MEDYSEQDLIEIPEPEESIDLTNVIAESGDDALADSSSAADGGAAAEVTTGDTDTAEADLNQEQVAGTAATVDGGQAAESDQPEQEQQRKRKDPQKRINTLSRRAKDAEERAAAAETKLALMEEEKLEGERKSREQEIIERRDEAANNGDLEAMLDASDELHAARQETPADAEQQSADDDQTAEADNNEPLPMADSAKAWIDRNAWFDDPDNSDLAQAAMEVENTLRQRGHELGEDLYKAIDKVIATDPRFEDVRSTGDASDSAGDADAGNTDATPAKAEERPNIPVTTSKTSEPTSSEKPGQLSKFDIKTMRNFNLDPDNAKHRKAFLSRKN